MSSKYKSTEEAIREGGSDVWPGCGKIGARMPCGHVHHATRTLSDGKLVVDHYCLENHNHGCSTARPLPIPKADKPSLPPSPLGWKFKIENLKEQLRQWSHLNDCCSKTAVTILADAIALLERE